MYHKAQHQYMCLTNKIINLFLRT